MVDTSVFVAAVHSPKGKSDTLRLIKHLVNDPRVGLVANRALVTEYADHAEQLGSETAASIAEAVMEKAVLVDVEARFLIACLPYIGKDKPADLLHAATCLKTGALLLTQDPDFDSIRDAKVIRAWRISEALANLGVVKQRPGSR